MEAEDHCSLEVVLPSGPSLDDTLAYFTDCLLFRVVTVFPADAPRVIVVEGHGLRVRLDRLATTPPGTLRLLCEDPRKTALKAAGGDESKIAVSDTGKEIAAEGSKPLLITAPNGTIIELIEADPGLSMPPANLQHQQLQVSS
jgi:hypothetical protein